MDYISLLCFAENQLHLSVNSQPQVYNRAGKVLQKSAEKVKVCLHWDHRGSVDQSVSEFLLQCLPNIHSLRYTAYMHINLVMPTSIFHLSLTSNVSFRNYYIELKL